MAFSGFPADTFRFLSGLAANNSKAWFDAHRADYEAFTWLPRKPSSKRSGPNLRPSRKR
ncbi:MAG: DUF2461 domain-containing protein [Rhizobiales bacterium]|nr:DUF2461 domain-containing protein [Hyphomicrobiales bacterium]